MVTVPSNEQGTPSPVATHPIPPTPVPTDSGTTPQPSQPGQTDTEWGRIWDGLPGSFPAYPGASPTETGEGPASAILDVGAADPVETTAFYQAALEAIGASTVAVSGPREDGSWEVEAVGDGGCRIRVTMTPLGGSTIVVILYGADCPFS